MEDKKLIAVLGATGHQGGSVLEYLLNSGRYCVRGITRNPTSEKCLQLKTKWGSALEWWKADMKNSDELIKAFEGCWGGFGVTDFWSNPEWMTEHEFDVGRTQIDAAVETKLKFFIFSSLPNVEQITEGKLTVPHLTSKAKVEEYARTEFVGRNIDTKFGLVQAGFYLGNFLGMYPTMGLKVKEGVVMNDPKLPVFANTKVAFLDTKQFGGWVLAMFDHPEQYAGKTVLATNGQATFPEMIEVAAKRLGLKSQYLTCSYDEFFEITRSNELVHMFRFFNEYGLMSTELEDTSQWFTPKTTDQIFNDVDWKALLQPSLTQQVGTKIGEATTQTDTLGTVKDTAVQTTENIRENLSNQAE